MKQENNALLGFAIILLYSTAIAFGAYEMGRERGHREFLDAIEKTHVGGTEL